MQDAESAAYFFQDQAEHNEAAHTQIDEVRASLNFFEPWISHRTGQLRFVRHNERPSLPPSHPADACPVVR